MQATIARERALFWAASPLFDAETQSATNALLDDPDALLSAFGTELSFGTGGLRGILGVGTGRMNRYTVARATEGLSAYLAQRENAQVAIAYDSRLCSHEFALTAACTLAAHGIRAHLYPRLMPTPMLSYAVRELRCDAGIVITASHNPAQYNGYKVYGPDGCQITEEAAAAITACIARVDYGAAQPMAEDEARARGLLVSIPESVVSSFIERTLACRVSPDVSAPIKLVYTPLHGTGLEPVRAVLARMKGVSCTEVAAQCMPDGHFPTCPKPNPELREALTLGLATAEESGADLLIATDPDCDRVGVAVRRRDGTWQVLTGNEVGLLLLRHILRARREQGALPEGARVVKTIVTSDLAFAIAADFGVRVEECLTGFKYIGEIIGRLEARGEEKLYLFGFEESCGYLAGTHVRDKDAVMASMLVAELAQCAAAQGSTLADELDALYARYGHMENRLLSFDIAGAIPMEEMRRIMAGMRGAPIASLCGREVTVARDYTQGVDGLPVSDVLSFATDDGLKAIVRPSGTEPKVKVYLSARAQTSEEAVHLLDGMEGELTRRILGKA